MKKIRILSIDGGGIRGILPGTILTYLEDELKKKTNNPHASIQNISTFLPARVRVEFLRLFILFQMKMASINTVQEML